MITLTQAGHTLVPDGKPRSAYIRTGTVGVVTAVHLDPDNPAGQALSVYFPSKCTVHAPWEYLTHRFPDGRDGGLAHAYAITAARAQGTTMDTARAVVPDDTSRAGLYVMLSRARTDVAAYLVARDELDDRDDDETWLPTEPSPQGPVGQLADRLGRSRPEQQAGEQDPLATTAHRLRRRHTLAELTALRLSQPTSVVGVPRQVVLRRAELAAEAALRAAALTNPPAALIARIGPRPAAGPDRATWEEVAGGLAIYHARHQPDVPPHEVGPPPVAGPHGQPADPWLERRQQAVWLADSWAAALPSVLRDRFGGASQALPRERAIAGLHALLDAGHQPGDLRAVLAETPLDGVRTGAAILEHRVIGLCQLAGVDAGRYELPTPRTAQQEWNDLFHLVRAAEINHLATQPTADLAAEQRFLTDALSRPGGVQTPAIPAGIKQRETGPDERAPSRSAGRERLAFLEAALNRQTTDALLQAKAEPAGYLTALLGPRPGGGLAAHGWDEAASRVEHYRHHVLGHPYGIPAQPDSANPTLHALGDRPIDPFDMTAYDAARDVAALHGGQLEL